MKKLFAAVLLALAAAFAAQAASVVDDRGRSVTLPPAPQRVISLLPSLTETVCALQACQRVVGTDRFSNWPASVRALPKLGGLEDTQIERIVALKPDLVLVPGSSRVIDRLETLGLRVVVLEPKSLQDTERVIHKVAQALGDAAAGPALWQRMQVRISANSRVLNAKLVQFNPDEVDPDTGMRGLELFLSWHGRGNYDGPNVSGSSFASSTPFSDILTSYAYEGSGKSYPFLTIIRELKTEEVDKALVQTTSGAKP